MMVNGRVLGVDVGERRVGLAISDPSGTLARPLKVLRVDGASDAVAQVASEVAQLFAEEDGLVAIVIGLPVRLDGSANVQTERATAFVQALSAHTVVPIVCEDERLSSREAESRLAVAEPDWRRRKAKLDAAAAAVILQDYLDRQRPHAQS